LYSLVYFAFTEQPAILDNSGFLFHKDYGSVVLNRLTDGDDWLAPLKVHP